MRQATIAVCLALATAVGAGCTTTPAPTTEQADTSAPATITYWSTGSEDEAAIFQKAADLYRQSHPNVTIKVQAITWDDAYAKILAASTSRSGPDIISGGLTWGIQFGRRGGMVDLRRHGIVDEIKSRALPGEWQSVTAANGAVYGVPIDMSTELLYYRTDLFEKHGIAAPPKTWDELTATIDKLEDAGVKTPFSIDWGNLDWIGYFNFLHQAGGSFYTRDCRPNLGTPQAEQALRFWVDLHRKYGAPTATKEASDALAAGTAMVISGNWIANGMDTNKPKLKGKWNIAALPAGPAGPTTFVGGRVMGIMSFSKYAAQAADFINFTYTDAAIAAMGREARGRAVMYVPPRPDKINEAGYSPEHTRVLQGIFKTGLGAPPCGGWDESAADVAKQLQSAILGKADARTALTKAAQVMERNAG